VGLLIRKAFFPLEVQAAARGHKERLRMDVASKPAGGKWTGHHVPKQVLD